MTPPSRLPLGAARPSRVPPGGPHARPQGECAIDAVPRLHKNLRNGALSNLLLHIMITKARDTLTVEGLVVGDGDADDDSFTAQRVEIEKSTGLICGVGEPEGRGDLVLGEDHLIFPGFIDVHVHAREDPSARDSYKETFATAGRAAVCGGVTAFVDMPNNPRPPVDDASYAAKRELTKNSPTDVLLYAGIGPGTRPLSFPVPYKAYMGPSVGDLFFESAEELREALARYRGQGVAFHAEAPEILARSSSAPTHVERRPPQAEVIAIERVLSMCDRFQIEPHICHLSTADGLELIREARDRGLKVTCEVTPHHLFYDQNNQSSFHLASYLQCNPPIRSRLDRIALLEAFRNDEIDYLATDHAPHTLEENEAGISGIPHLDTFGTFLFWLHSEGISWQTIRRTCSERPGRMLNRYLPDLYGRIAEGFVGSLSVLRQKPRTIRRGDLRSKAGWSPFEGLEWQGQVSHTIVRSRVYCGGEEREG